MECWGNCACGAAYRFAADWAGRIVPCTKCGAPMLVPPAVAPREFVSQYKPPSESGKNVVGLLIIGLMGFGFTSIALYQVGRELTDRYSYPSTVSGRVTGGFVETARSRKGGSLSVKSRVTAEFFVDGRPFEVAGERDKAVSIDEMIPIRYDPRDPRRSQVVPHAAPFAQPLWFLCLGAFFLWGLASARARMKNRT